MECPTLIAFPVSLAYGRSELTRNPYVRFFCVLFIIHYINRAIIYPLRIPSHAAKVSIVTVLAALIFQTVNSGLIFVYLFQKADLRFYYGYWTDPRFLLGSFLFIAGLAINIQSDDVLRRLRKDRNKKGYSTPQGALFEYVSCANYFGELLEWTGFAIATWSLPGLIFAEWTFINLVPRALKTHEYYKQTFEGYPKNRRAIIPFLL